MSSRASKTALPIAQATKGYNAMIGVLTCVGGGQYAFNSEDRGEVRGWESPTREMKRESDRIPMEIIATRPYVESKSSYHRRSSESKSRHRRHSSGPKPRYHRQDNVEATGRHRQQAPNLPSVSSNLVQVRLRKPMGIVFEPNSDDENIYGGGVRISELMRAGLAYRSGKLEVWDELLQINGTDMSHRSFDDVIAFIRRSDPTEYLDMLFLRPGGVLTTFS